MNVPIKAILPQFGCFCVSIHKAAKKFVEYIQNFVKL
jgi:hypothetical protein